jgi:hypothetical protein
VVLTKSRDPHPCYLPRWAVGAIVEEGIAPYVKVLVVHCLRFLLAQSACRILYYCREAGLVDVTRGALQIDMGDVAVVGEVDELGIGRLGLGLAPCR